MDRRARIRQLHRDGFTVREIAAPLRHSSKTTPKVPSGPPPDPRAPPLTRVAPAFGPFRAVGGGILAADESAPREQRHTARRIFRRLVTGHGFPGSYPTVPRYLSARRRDRRDAFTPPDHRPGVRAEADSGHVRVDPPDGRTPVSVRIVTRSSSDAPFAIPRPAERTEAVRHGLVEAFGFFGRVPAALWWDNPTAVAARAFAGRDRTVHPRYAASAAHLAASNAHPRPRRVAARGRTSGGNADAVPVRSGRDRSAATAAPARPFDPRVHRPAPVGKHQTARFDGNRDGVPRRWAFRPATAKGYVDRTEVPGGGRATPTRPRPYGRGEEVLDPTHFPVTPGARPAAPGHAPVYRDRALPAAFPAPRHAPEDRAGKAAGARQYVRVLRLLARRPVGRVAEAIAAGPPDGARTTTAARRRAAVTPGAAAGVVAVPAAAAPLPDPSRFDRLRSHVPRRDGSDGRRERPAGEGRPAATRAPGDAGRVGEAGP